MDAAQWARELLAIWRKRVEPLKATHRISNLDDLSSPVQLTLFLSDSPPASLIFITHSGREKDGEIRIYGPTSPGKLLRLAESALAEPLWDTPISGDSRTTISPDRESTYRTLAEARLIGFFKQLQARLFNESPATGHPGKTWFAELGSASWQSWGLITEIPPEDLVERLVEGAEVRAAPATLEAPSPSPQVENPPKTPRYDGFGSYLFPPMRVGAAPKRGLAASVLGDAFSMIDLGPLIHEARIGGQRVLITHNGFVGVIATKERRALRVLNAIALALNLAGKTCHPFRGEDLGQFDWNAENPRGWGGWTMPDAVRFSLSKGSEDPYLPWVSLTEFTAVLHAADSLIASDTPDDDALLLEAMAHLSQNEFSPSFLMSWMIVEKALNASWRRFLDEKQLDEDREKKLLVSAVWSADSVAEVMSLNGRLSEGEYTQLMRLKKIRNDLLHGRRQATRSDAEFALEAALASLGHEQP